MSHQFEFKFDSDPANLAATRKALESFALNHGFTDACCGDVGLCLNEILANVIRHAYNNAADKPIHVRAQADQEKLVIEIRDWGNGVDPSKLPQPPYDPLSPGGVGLLCIKQLMDRVTYHPQPDGMLTRVIKRRDEK